MTPAPSRRRRGGRAFTACWSRITSGIWRRVGRGWNGGLGRGGGPWRPWGAARPVHRGAGRSKPKPWGGAKITASKMAVEARPLLAMAPDRATLASGTDDATWAKIAALHAADAKLDATSHAVIASKGINAVAAMQAAISKTIVEDPIVQMI